MEESSNGKNEVIQKVESLEEDNKVVIKEVEELKLEDESERQVAIDGCSESVKETVDGNDLSLKGSSSSGKESEDKEKSLELESGILEDEIEVINTVEEVSGSVEALVKKSKDPDVIEVETREIKEKILQSSNDTDMTGPVLADVVLNGTEDKPPPPPPPPSFADKTDEGVSKLMSNGTGKIKLPSSDEKDALSPVVIDVVSKGTEEKVLPSSDENTGVPLALTGTVSVSKGIEEAKVAAPEDNTGEVSGTTDKEHVKDADVASKLVDNATVVGSSDGVPESTENPSTVPPNQRIVQTTSWRSCCGLFEVLRGSNR